MARTLLPVTCCVFVILNLITALSRSFINTFIIRGEFIPPVLWQNHDLGLSPIPSMLFSLVVEFVVEGVKPLLTLH